GALFPLTGSLANYGEESIKAAQMATDEINAGGGINGVKLVIDFLDHKCDPTTAKSIFEQETSLKEIKVFVVQQCSGTVLSIAPLLVDNNAIILGTAVSTPKLSGISPNFFRNWALDSSEAELFAKEANKRGLKRIGIIYEQTDYAKGLSDYFQNGLKNHESSPVIVIESFNSNSADVRSQLAKLKDRNLDALFISVQTVASGDLVLKQMTEIGFKPKTIFGSDYIIKTGDFLKKYSLLEGAIGADFIPANSEAYKEYQNKFKEKYGFFPLQPNFSGAQYDSILFLAKAISVSGTDANEISKYLKTHSFNGASGTLAFDLKNDRKNANYTPVIVKNGKVILLETK
ncbi:MAG: ABC transporter substrate-binding protein, partial [archaeon]